MVVALVVLSALVAGLALLLGIEMVLRRRQVRADAAQARELAKADAQLREVIAEMKTALGYGGDGSAPDLLTEMRSVRVLLRRMTDRSAAVRERAEGVMARAAAAEVVGEKLSQVEVVEILKGALEGNRVDLYLQPIVTLPQRKVRYYESFGRIRTDRGTVLVPGQYRRAAASAGQLPDIENLLFLRCVQSVRRAWKEKIDVGFFFNIAREALLDELFFDQFVEFLERNKDLAASLVLELAQDDFDDMRLAKPLAAVYKLGFSFSIDNVNRFSADVDERARRGVRFIKVDAAQMLSPSPPVQSNIHVADWGERLKRAGIALIAEKVEEESQAVGLLDLNVALAQGLLFGEPRPLREAS